MNAPDPSIREFVYLPLARWPRLLNPFWHLLMMKSCLALYAPWVYPMVICWVVFRIFQTTEFGQIFGGFAGLLFIGGWFYTFYVMVSGVAWGTEARRLASIGLIIFIVDFLILAFASAYVVYPYVMRRVQDPHVLQTNPVLNDYVNGYLQAAPDIRHALDRQGLYAFGSICANCKLGWKVFWFIHHDLDNAVPNFIFGKQNEHSIIVMSDESESMAKFDVNTVNTWLLTLQGGVRSTTYKQVLMGYPDVGYAVNWREGRATVYMESGGDPRRAISEISSAFANGILNNGRTDYARVDRYGAKFVRIHPELSWRSHPGT